MIAPLESRLPGIGTTIFTVMSELARQHGVARALHRRVGQHCLAEEEARLHIPDNHGVKAERARVVQ